MTSKVSTTKKLVSASALMASGTLVSRALGLVRVMMVAFILGNGTRQADMLALATMVPNSLYILFAGGALNTVLVPQIVRAIRNDPDGGEAYTNRIMTAFMLIVGAVAVVATIGAPLITALYSSDSWRAPELADQYASMVMLTYLTLPQIFFYGAFFLLGQVLNARDRFGPMMWAPIANNVISILVMGLYLVVWGTGGDRGAAFTTGQLWLLGLGSTVGIAAQTIVLLPYLRRVGFKFRPRFDLKGTGLGHTFSLTKWTIGFVAVNQLALLIVTRLGTSATATGAGSGINVYSNAHLIWILPHSLITVSLTTAMLPNASRLAAAGDLPGVAAEATKTMRLALILLVPSAVGFFALAGPISALLFGHGHGSADAGMVAWALMAFAVGLVPFTIQFVCLRTYYALENTRTPFWLQCVIAAINAGLALLFVRFTDDPGVVAALLALSYSLAYAAGVFLSWHFLRKRVPDLVGMATLMHVVRLSLGAIAGGVGAYFASIAIIGWLGTGIIGNAVAVAVGLALIGAGYYGGGKLLHIREFENLHDLLNLVLRRKGGTQPARQASGPDARSDTGPAVTVVAPQPQAPLLEDLMPTELTPVVTDDGPHDFPAGPVPPEDDMAAALDAITAIDDTRVWEPFARPREDSPEVATPAVCERGQLLETRYRVDELMRRRPGVETWRAHDLVLSRDVVLHVLPAGDHRIPTTIAAARRAALATDSRFVRVLDAIDFPAADVGAGAVGAIVVCEYVEGESLTNLLTGGPLTPVEAAWVTRELADALSGQHAQGLFHEHVDPDQVIIAGSGDARLLSFSAKQVYDPADDATNWHLKESKDVRGLAAVLYASLVQRWPGGAAYGLAAAPVIAGEPAGPHVVRGGVPPVLDRIVSATLTERGAAGDSRITTASQLSTALGQFLGGQSAQAMLEQRLAPGAGNVVAPEPSARPVPSSMDFAFEAPRATGSHDPWDTASLPPSQPAPEQARQQTPQMSPRPSQPVPEQAWQQTPQMSPHPSQPVPGQAWQQTPPMSPRPSQPAPPYASPQPLPTGQAAQAQPAAVPGEPVGDRPADSHRARTRKAALWIATTLAIVALILWLVISAVNSARQQSGAGTSSDSQTTAGQSATSPSATGSPDGPFKIVTGVDFDPAADGGNGEENPKAVPLAFDGDKTTGWPTMRYKNRPDLGGLKPGVGLVLDLGEPRPVSRVDLLFQAAGATVEIRVPKNADVTVAPMASQSEWVSVASQADAPAEVTLKPESATTSRFVLVYLTKLPQVEEKRYLAQINEISIR